jgi:hypothetical protein
MMIRPLLLSARRCLGVKDVSLGRTVSNRMSTD